MSNYKHNTPTFNVDRKVANFHDFVSNIGSEKEELEDVKRSFKHEPGEITNLPNKSKYKWNKVTHKMDDVSKTQVQDRLNAIEELSENVELSNVGKNCIFGTRRDPSHKIYSGTISGEDGNIYIIKPNVSSKWGSTGECRRKKDEVEIGEPTSEMLKYRYFKWV